MGDRTAFEPPPRLVDGTILALVGLEIASGLVSLVAGTPDWAWLFAAHAIGGLSLVVLLGWKLRRVFPRVRRPSSWPDGVGVSLLLAALAIAALATGIAWALLDLVRISGYTLLTIHMVLGLLVGAVLVWHLRHRFRLPRRRDVEGRRTMLQFAGTVGVAALTWRLQDALGGLAGLGGGPDRFTGSERAGGAGNEFPVTSWVADDPAPIDPAEWRLDIAGHVREPASYSQQELTDGEHGEFETGTGESAVLDCTSGWYADRHWQGVRVGDVLDRVGTTADARWVRVVSITGYRWSFPIDEARDFLLATRVGGDPLSHGHGAPLRLVAPGRRGFQWVKWIDRVEVTRHQDLSQWLAIFVSGFVE